MDTVDTILLELRARGYRRTRIREAIMRVIGQNARPMASGDVQEALRRTKVLANKATVYRELDFLLRQGVIHKVLLGEGVSRYELAGRDHHHHLVCTTCASVTHVELEEKLDQQERKIAKENKFKILNHSLEFFGLCQNCQS